MKTNFHNDRSGVALVIVLGLLSIMVILAIAFSISTRTERAAARSYIDVVKARQLVHTSLNRVIGDHIGSAMQRQVYPTNDVLTSGADTDTNNVVFHLGDKGIYSGASFVPMSLRTGAFAADGARWIPLQNQANQYIGEYSFLVINSSGLLDAMAVGGRSRSSGTNAAEIQVSSNILPEAIFVDTSLSNVRNLFGRFESVSEFYYLLSSSSSDVSYRGPALLKSLPGSMADNFHVFSRFPHGYAEDDLGAVTNAGYVGGNPSEWRVNEIEAALQGLDNSPIPDIPGFVRALTDYADEDLFPAGSSDAERFNRVSSEPVPMINEVIVSNTFELVRGTAPAPDTLTHRVYVVTEFWYPFPRDPDNPPYTLLLNGVPEITVQSRVRYPQFQSSVPYIVDAAAPTFTNGAFSYAVVTNVYRQSQAVNGSTGLPYPPPGNRMAVQVTLRQNTDVQVAGRVVDRVNGPWPAFTLTGNAPATPPSTPVNFMSPAQTALAANDPRINWNPASGAGQWLVAGGSVSVGGFNTGYVNGNNDEIGFMYARQGPIQSIGELSYLLFDASKPWTTIRLMGAYPSGYPASITEIIDRLSIQSPTSAPRRGLVNPNTRQTNALASVFWDMPIERYPSSSDQFRFDTNTAVRSVAAHLRDRVQTQGTITNLSHICDRLERSVIDPILGTSTNKFVRESLVRNSLGLLSPRHNMFTIFLAARTFVDGYAYNPADTPTTKSQYVASEQRAVAVVWRDPYEITDRAGNATYQSWIQYFHWFSGAFDN